jgi:beta-lactamase regulating signal transducer with metallopeptidase domain
MQFLFLYIVKLSVSLAIVYLFYQLFLRRLTFYSHNRWYLVGYSLLCFVIPFIDISPAVDTSKALTNGLIGLIPVVDQITRPVSSMPGNSGWTGFDWLFLVLLAGTVLMIFRLVFQYISFTRMRRSAKLVSGETIKFYEVDKNIIPFSFGNSIFVNPALHTESELQEIIRHEFVHVKQNHSVDIIIAELLCSLNWYNPFAWLIRRSIRQNLEFIADNRVLQNGMDKRHYQYLLLKVMGNDHFAMGNPFNFSSLKNRIVMMNKMRTARVHLTRFLFLLPLLAVVLLSFRSADPGSDTVVRDIEPQSNSLAGSALQGSSTPSPEIIAQDTTKPVKKKTERPDATPLKADDKSAGDSKSKPAQKNTDGSITTTKPHIIVDGVEWPEGLDINLIDPAKIESMDVSKGEETQKKYGAKGKNGVIVVTTKTSKTLQSAEAVLPSNVLYYIDGKAATKQSVELLEPNKIKSIDILKGVKAEEKYGEKAKAGVVEIITITPKQINYIEHKPLPVLDIRSVLVGKKQEEC